MWFVINMLLESDVDPPLMGDDEREICNINLQSQYRGCSSLEVLLPTPKLIDFKCPYGKDYEVEVQLMLQVYADRCATLVVMHSSINMISGRSFPQTLLWILCYSTW